jgi:DNA helicase II / ATP-dependent DNA helicase PcrA
MQSSNALPGNARRKAGVVVKEITTSDLTKVLGFNPSAEQIAAIVSPLEPSMIVAGAGTGKTTVMAGRIAWLIMTQQVPPDRILGLTFTTKAANELLTRVRSFLPEALKYLPDESAHSDLGEPVISTYNAFGSRLLKEHALRLGLEPDARVVVDATRYQLAMRVVCQSNYDLGGLGYSPTTAVTEMLKLDEQCSNYLVDPNHIIEKDSQRLISLEGIGKKQELTHDMIKTCLKRISLAKLVLDFRQAKISNDVIDYADQIRLAAQAAQNSQAMRDILKEQFHAVLLDEYQDTSLSQKVLLQELFGQGHPVMAVGDPCQAIYGWRGAEITNMENFKFDFERQVSGKWEPAQVYKLTANRRSGQNILTAANSLSNKLREIHPEIVELVTADDAKPAGEIQTALLPTFTDEVEWVAEQISKIKPVKSWNEVAVLLREKKNAQYYVNALEAKGIPVQVVDPGALINLPEVREVVSYLEAIYDPTANTALARILLSPRWQIGSRDLAILGRHASELVRVDVTPEMPIDVQLDHIVSAVDKSQRVSLLDALELVSEDETLPYSPEARVRLVELASQLRMLRKFCNESAIDLISRIIRVTGIGIEAMVVNSPEGSTHFDRLAALIDLAGNFRNLEGDSSVAAFLEFLRTGQRFNSLVEADVTLSDNAVIVMSIHKSKGLEFPIVVIPDLTVGVFPSTPKDRHWPKNAFRIPPDALGAPINPLLPEFPSPTGPRGVDFKAFTSAAGELATTDERRLAYVAVTRAEQKVIASGSWWGPTQSRLRGPSDFLINLHDGATHPDVWTQTPNADATNPLLSEVQYLSWPAQIDTAKQSQVQRDAELVRSATIAMHDESGLSSAEKALVESWQQDIDALVLQSRQFESSERLVRLPSSLSASQLIALNTDEDTFLKSLVRPMPRKPSSAADRGTTFHSWVETFYGSRTLIDTETLAGAMDDEIYTDEQLQALKSAFESGPFVNRTPASLELPFALVLGGRTLRGRLDALFTGTLDDPNAADSWLVVDWKTGKPGSANDLQLSIYRQAAAQSLGVNPEQIQAAFYYVADQVVSTPQNLLSLDELAELIL